MSMRSPRDGAYARVLRIEFITPQDLDHFLLTIRRLWKITEPAVREADYMVIGDQVEFMQSVVRVWHDDIARISEAISWLAVVAEIDELSVKRTK